MINDDAVKMPRMLVTRACLASLGKESLKVVVPLALVSFWLLFRINVGTAGTSVESTANIILEFLRLMLIGYYNYLILYLNWYGWMSSGLLAKSIYHTAEFCSILMTGIGIYNLVRHFPHHLANCMAHPMLVVLLLVTIVVTAKIVSRFRETLPPALLDYRNWQTYNGWVMIKITFQDLYQYAPQ